MHGLEISEMNARHLTINGLQWFLSFRSRSVQHLHKPVKATCNIPSYLPASNGKLKPDEI